MVFLRHTLILFLVAVIAPICSAQDEVIKVSTDLVRVPVIVRDRDNRFIPDLEKNNFKLLEDGKEQSIEYFRTTDEPVTVILLLDCSGSMAEEMEQMTLAANSFFRQLRPNATVLAATFARKVSIIGGPALAKDFSVASINQKGEPGTRLYDSVNWALKKAKSFHGRTAIILFSDGADSYPTDGSFASAKETFKKAEEGNALIYSVWFDTFYRDEGMTEETFLKIRDRYWSYMDGLASRTGGVAFGIKAIAGLDTVFSQVAGELRSRYEVGYVPVDSVRKGERRKIAVKVDVPGAVVRSRKEVVYQ